MVSAIGYTSPPQHSLKALAVREAPRHATLRLNFTSIGSFSIAQIADVHLGESDEKDHTSLHVVSSLLDMESVELAVLSGDQITGKRIRSGAREVWQKLTDVLDARGLPHTAILGNHDGEPFLSPRVTNASAQEYHKMQNSPGANVSRSELMENDSTLPNSLSQASPEWLRPASSSYVIDVLPRDGGRPFLTLFHLDTGGGGVRQNIAPAQVAWFEDELAQHTRLHPTTPIIVFSHIPLHLYNAAWRIGDCFGVKSDGISPPLDGTGDEILTRIAASSTLVKAFFVGHDHCNDFCCRAEGLYLCYGRHSGAGGRQCAEYALGMRFIRFDSWERSWQLSTHVRLVNGTISQEGVLASSPL